MEWPCHEVACGTGVEECVYVGVRAPGCVSWCVYVQECFSGVVVCVSIHVCMCVCGI